MYRALEQLARCGLEDIELKNTIAYKYQVYNVGIEAAETDRNPFAGLPPFGSGAAARRDKLQDASQCYFKQLGEMTGLSIRDSWSAAETPPDDEIFFSVDGNIVFDKGDSMGISILFPFAYLDQR